MKYVLQICSMDNESSWLLLVVIAGAREGAVRIRVWRALKSLGAGVLRDGVYLVPARPTLEAALRDQRAAIEEAGGMAFLFSIPAIGAGDHEQLRALFDRSDDYAKLLTSIRAWSESIEESAELEGRRGLRQLKREYEAIAATDFFAGSAHAEARGALSAAEAAFTRRVAPEEPVAVVRTIERLDRARFHRSVWATRTHLWVDRVASAWLIRRFIDTQAQFVWIEHPSDAPKNAIGFDFEGARFTHVGELVTFEVLVESFGLGADAGLMRVGKLVRAIDTGAITIREAAGFEAMLAGARERHPNDDDLLSAISEILDSFYVSYSSTKSQQESMVRS